MRVETLRLYPFKPAARQLSSAEFRNLTQNGFTEHIFPNGRKLAFTLRRGTDVFGQPTACLDAFELKGDRSFAYAGKFALAVVSQERNLAEENSVFAFYPACSFDFSTLEFLISSGFPSSIAEVEMWQMLLPADRGNLFVAQDYRSPKDRDPKPAMCLKTNCGRNGKRTKRLYLIRAGSRRDPILTF